MPITLTTDFGLDDAFVAIMKGVILCGSPQARLIDICHTIPPQAIAHAGRLLSEAAPFFPANTIHLAVVDPGVGTHRSIICVQARDQLFLAPDNGLLTPFLTEAEAAFEVTNAELFRHPISATFHGRDIFAPVAAALANGLKPHLLGPAQTPDNLVRLEPPLPVQTRQHLRGQCIRADRFGNMATNIRKKDLAAFLAAGATPIFTIAGTTIIGLKHTYGDKKTSAVALLNSQDEVEIAIPGGNATALLSLSPGMPIMVDLQQPTQGKGSSPRPT